MKTKKIHVERDNETIKVFNSDSELIATLTYKKSTIAICCNEECMIRDWGRRNNLRRDPFLCEICMEIDVSDYIPDLEKMGVTEGELIHLLSGKVIKKKAKNLC